MKHIFVATTAMVALMTTSAMATGNSDKTPELNTAPLGEMHMQPATPETADKADSLVKFDIFTKEVSPGATESQNGYLDAQPGQVLLSDLMGETVYSSEVDEDGVRVLIGDINDIVLDRKGNAKAAVVGVGGVIGLGEKEIAVDFDHIHWANWDNERHLVMAATMGELESAPEFNRDGVRTMNNAELLIIDQNKLSAEQLIGTSVYGEHLNEIGEVGDVILDGDKKVEAYIVDVGGFLGINAKSVELSADKLNIFADGQGVLHVYTPFTQEQLEGMPVFEGENQKLSFLK